VNIRKIAVVGSFAAGAALALAPIASADDLTTIDSDEISVLNSIFKSTPAAARAFPCVLDWRILPVLNVRGQALVAA